jgi:hypothetical protein
MAPQIEPASVPRPPTTTAVRMAKLRVRLNPAGLTMLLANP